MRAISKIILFCSCMLCFAPNAIGIARQLDNTGLPQLELVTSDTFQKNSDGQYRLSGNAGWNSQKLKIFTNASAALNFAPSPWVEVTLDLEFPVPKSDGASSELRIWFDVKSHSDSFVSFQQKRLNGKTESKIWIVKGKGDYRSGSVDGALGDAAASPGGLISGEYAISCRHGVWRVKPPGQPPFYRFAHNANGTIHAIVATSHIAAAAIKKLELKKAPLSRSLASDNDEKTLAAVVSLASRGQTLVNHDKLVKVLPLLEEAYAKMQPLKNVFVPEYASVTSNLGFLYRKLGRFDLAEPKLLESTQVSKKLGLRHPDFATSLYALSAYYIETGDYAEAETHCQTELAIRKEVLGESNIDYARSLSLLGSLRDRLGAPEEAKALFVKARDLTAASSGTKNSDFAAMTGNLATHFMNVGKHSKALPLATLAFELEKSNFGLNHISSATSLNSVVLCQR